METCFNVGVWFFGFFNCEVYLQICGSIKEIKLSHQQLPPSACDMWALILGVTLDAQLGFWP